MRVSKFRFHEFELDVASRELRRDGLRVALPPKSFECVTYLLANRERAVGRDELISAVWGRVDVSDTVVAQTLFRARKALGDSGQEPRLIRTVPRFGYQWIAVLPERPTICVEASTHVPSTSAPCVARARIAWHGWGSLLLLFSAAGFAGWVLPRDRGTPVGAPVSSAARNAAPDVTLGLDDATPCVRKQGAPVSTRIGCIARSQPMRDARGAAYPASATRTSP